MTFAKNNLQKGNLFSPKFNTKKDYRFLLSITAPKPSSNNVTGSGTSIIPTSRRMIQKGPKPEKHAYSEEDHGFTGPYITAGPRHGTRTGLTRKNRFSVSGSLSQRTRLRLRIHCLRSRKERSRL